MDSLEVGKFAEKIKCIKRAVKIRLLPTREQEILFWKSAGTARWAYNYFLNASEKAYKEGRILRESEVRKYINNVLKKTTHTWLKEVGGNVMKQGVKDANLALQRYFKGVSGKPKFKSRRKSKISFYVNYETLKRTVNGFHGEKIGFVKTVTTLPKIAKDKKYVNPHISFDGKYWYLSVGYEVRQDKVELTDEIIGIDLGIKALAVVSNQDASRTKYYKNINKSAKVRRLEKKLRRAHRKASRKLEANTKCRDENCRPIWKRTLRECRNLQRQNQVLRQIYKKLTDIRNNYLHQITAEIVKTKPFQIVMEDLNVKGMMKCKHLAEAIAKQKFYEFKRQIQYKAEAYGIKVVLADRFYASSKTCSHCGHIKHDLKLSARTYICSICGANLDRDLNAAINLANYKTA